MRPLQEHAHLFANGRFKVKIHYGKSRKLIEEFTWKQLCTVLAHTKHCTLIARPIEDMTDGEAEDIYNSSCEVDVNLSHDSCDMMREFWEQRTKSGNLKFSTARWMLKIGVYPFDQSHFDDGTVIDRTTL